MPEWATTVTGWANLAVTLFILAGIVLAAVQKVRNFAGRVLGGIFNKLIGGTLSGILDPWLGKFEKKFEEFEKKFESINERLNAHEATDNAVMKRLDETNKQYNETRTVLARLDGRWEGWFGREFREKK